MKHSAIRINIANFNMNYITLMIYRDYFVMQNCCISHPVRAEDVCLRPPNLIGIHIQYIIVQLVFVCDLSYLKYKSLAIS